MSYSINQVKKAGKNLIRDENIIESLEILSHWRSCHATSLEKAYKIVQEHAPKIDASCMIAKRLKRTPSIISKLRRFNETMQLTTMQDIGGCRVVLSNMKKVEKLVKLLEKNKYFELRNNYIKSPKQDGYRSIHLIGKFKNHNNIDKYIELQVRTKIQHYWATAIEIVDLFTKQSIKTNEGDKAWSELFRLLSKNFIYFDQNPYINSGEGKSQQTLNKKDLMVFESLYRNINNNLNNDTIKELDEIERLAIKLDIVRKFKLFAKSIQIANNDLTKNHNMIPEDGYVLISVEQDTKTSFIMNNYYYHKHEFDSATKNYLELETKSIKNNSFTNNRIVTVLVSTTAVGGIKEAYPNYFADSEQFMKQVEMLLGVNKLLKRNMPILKRLFSKGFKIY